MSTLVLEVKFPPPRDPAAFSAGVFNLFQAHGNAFDARLKTERMSGRPGVRRRTGHLAGGWNVDTTQAGNTIQTTNWLTGPAAEKNGQHGYGWVQEHGAVIRPVKAKYLWIPTEENQTPTGVARITPTEAINRGGFIHNGVFFGKTIFKTQKAKAMAMPGAKGMKGHVFAGREPLVPLFVLKKQVEIPARLGATTLWNSMASELERGIDRLVREAA